MEPVSWTTEELSLLKKGNELEYDEEAIYTQFYDMKVTKKFDKRPTGRCYW